MKTILKNEVLYPVLIADNKGYVKFPICQQIHKHGKGGGDGHRVAVCTVFLINSPIFTVDGRIQKENGYFVDFS